jgi:hypothetical protein
VGFACAAGEGSEWAGTITDSAGIQIIENPAMGSWDENTRWQLTEEFRIGSAEGDINYQFGQITGVTVGGSGDIYVLDQQAAEIRVFAASGEYLRTIGTSGGGPGEIGALGGAALIDAPADTLGVVDMRNMRVQHFVESGSPAGNYRIDMADGIPIKWQDSQSGLAVVQVRPMQFTPDQPVADSMDTIVARRTDGTTVDTLMKVPAGKTFSMSGGSPEFHFFSPEPMWALAVGGGVWYGVNNTYEIGLYDDAGTLVRMVKKPFEPMVVAEEDKTIMVDMIINAIGQQGQAPPQMIEQFRSAISFEDMYPAYQQFFGGPAGSLWVQHLQVPSELTEAERQDFNPMNSPGSRSWDVFDSEGRFLGVIQMPNKFRPLRFTDDRIYGVWRDELDVQYVMALRVGVTGDQPVTVDVGGP